MIETGVFFDNIHSFYDLNLILSGVLIPPATPKTTFVDVPGADGTVDLTEAHGEVKYNDRDGCKFTFSMNPAGNLSEAAWEAKKTEVSNLLNGRKFKITLDKDPDYYYTGRVTVSEYLSDKRHRQIVVTGRVAPWKWKNDVTRVFHNLTGNRGKNLFNLTGAPTLYSSGATCTVQGTGYRVNWKGGRGSFVIVGLVPLRLVVGQTVTLSAKIAPFGKGVGYVRLGYAASNGTPRISKKSISSTGSVTLTVTDDDPNVEYLAVWMYSNYNTDADGMTTADGVDYTDIQLEIGDTATQYSTFSDVVGVARIPLTNDRKPVVPTVVCSAETKLTVDGAEYVVSAGTHKILDFKLNEGESTVDVEGVGAVAFIYQEGAL